MIDDPPDARCGCQRSSQHNAETLCSNFARECSNENDAAGTSKRTLARRMQQVLGKTPLSYFQDLRVERAVHLLKTSDKSLEQIATLVGYAEGVTLRALLRQRLGRGVRDLRTADRDEKNPA